MTTLDLKAAVRERDSHRCVDCGSEGDGSDRIPVHRIVPGRRGGTYSFENCVTLCQTCHNKRHVGPNAPRVLGRLPGGPKRLTIRLHLPTVVANALEAYVVDFNDKEMLNTPMSDHITKAILQYLKTVGWPVDQSAGDGAK